MAIYDDVVGLENFIQRVIHISQCLTACNLEVNAASPLRTSPPSPEPMQIDSYIIPVRLPCPVVNNLQLQPVIAPIIMHYHVGNLCSPVCFSASTP